MGNFQSHSSKTARELLIIPSSSMKIVRPHTLWFHFTANLLWWFTHNNRKKKKAGKAAKKLRGNPALRFRYAIKTQDFSRNYILDNKIAFYYPFAILPFCRNVKLTWNFLHFAASSANQRRAMEKAGRKKWCGSQKKESEIEIENSKRAKKR